MGSSSYSLSTLSTSNKSVLSTRSVEEEDLTKDRPAAPIDLECLIQTERITKIIDEIIYKVKLGLSLPQLVRAGNLRSIMTEQHCDEVYYIYAECFLMAYTSVPDLQALNDIKSGDLSMKKRICPELGHLIYILNSYSALRPVVESMVDEMKNSYESYKTIPAQPGLEYLLTLEQFRKLTVTALKTTAADYWTARFIVRATEGANDKVIHEIDEFSTSIENEQMNFEEVMAMKTEVIGKLELEVANLDIEANSMLNKKILDSERQMVLATRSHDVRQEILEEEETDSMAAYEQLLRRDVIEEKKRRGHRCKVEAQLMSWIQKYDLEMGDKQVDLDEMTVKYEVEAKRSKECEAILLEQDKEYLPLMEEREKEYHEELAAKATKFLLEHAARIIQNSWRDVLKNRLDKKKLKKQIKKMMEQKAKEEAAAELAARKQAAAEKRAAKAAEAAKKKK